MDTILPTVARSSDGLPLVLRPGVPGDVTALAALHERCSPESLYARYHAGTGPMPLSWLARLATPANGLALVAVRGPEIVGIAQLIRLPGGTDAEIALLVEDAWQRRGVGTALVKGLALGYPPCRWVAWCLPGSHGPARIADRLGYRVDVRADRGESLITIHPRGTLLRSAP